MRTEPRHCEGAHGAADCGCLTPPSRSVSALLCPSNAFLKVGTKVSNSRILCPTNWSQALGFRVLSILSEFQSEVYLAGCHYSHTLLIPACPVPQKRIFCIHTYGRAQAYLSIYFSFVLIHLSKLSAHLCICLPACLSVCLSKNPSICLSVCLPIYLSIYARVYPPINPSIFPVSLPLSLSLSPSLPLHLSI